MPDLSAVLVDGRGRTRTVALFNMRCDGQQIPESLDGNKTRMYRARATFTGQAAPWNEGSPGSCRTCNRRRQSGSRGRRGQGLRYPDAGSRGGPVRVVHLAVARTAGHFDTVSRVF